MDLVLPTSAECDVLVEKKQLELLKEYYIHEEAVVKEWKLKSEVYMTDLNIDTRNNVWDLNRQGLKLYVKLAMERALARGLSACRLDFKAKKTSGLLWPQKLAIKPVSEWKKKETTKEKVFIYDYPGNSSLLVLDKEWVETTLATELTEKGFKWELLPVKKNYETGKYKHLMLGIIWGVKVQDAAPKIKLCIICGGEDKTKCDCHEMHKKRHREIEEMRRKDTQKVELEESI